MFLHPLHPTRIVVRHLAFSKMYMAAWAMASIPACHRHYVGKKGHGQSASESMSPGEWSLQQHVEHRENQLPDAVLIWHARRSATSRCMLSRDDKSWEVSSTDWGVRGSTVKTMGARAGAYNCPCHVCMRSAFFWYISSRAQAKEEKVTGNSVPPGHEMRMCEEGGATPAMRTKKRSRATG